MHDFVLMWCSKTVVQMSKIHSLNSHTVPSPSTRLMYKTNIKTCQTLNEQPSYLEIIVEIMRRICTIDGEEQGIQVYH